MGFNRVTIYKKEKTKDTPALMICTDLDDKTEVMESSTKKISRWKELKEEKKEDWDFNE